MFEAFESTSDMHTLVLKGSLCVEKKKLYVGAGRLVGRHYSNPGGGGGVQILKPGVLFIF